MSPKISHEYLSIGGNRQTAASAWSTTCGALAFGADQNIAIWYPANQDLVGIRCLLNGHNDKVTAIAFLENPTDPLNTYLISGSADGEVIVWRSGAQSWRLVTRTNAHDAAVNVITCLDATNFFATGGANAELKLWKVGIDGLFQVASLTPKPRIIPLALVLGTFPSISANEGCFMVVGGTRTDIQAYVIKDIQKAPVVELQALLKGHEGWIRSLSLTSTNDHELLLASASADKYVRLWKFSSNVAERETLASQKQPDVVYEQALQAKAQIVSIGSITYTITFEALLLGHEDWVYSTAWSPRDGSDQLLTASADGTLSIWEPDSASGIWISTSKLGEISGQKGATTATGSAGGFWTALWSPSGDVVTCLGRTGSWRVWKYNSDTTYWQQKAGISGHTSSVNGIVWATSGQYVLSTSSDQTTRLHSEWRSNHRQSWHEFSRPQIHGYDINCVTFTTGYQFVSGADEKLLRVFNEPRDIAMMLHNLCGVEQPAGEDLPDMAAIPVLGLSNKAIGEEDESFTEVNGKRDREYVAPSVLETSLASLTEPPNEDILARHTLWPEHEKLYGHGYEISECAASGKFLATACKASSTDHAVIRLYDTTLWAEVKPPLQAHALTVTRLVWSKSSRPYLLSVGRDRQWAVFGQSLDRSHFTLIQSNAKAHTRMVLDAAWSPVDSQLFFATAGRDKLVKMWCNEQQNPGDGSGEELLGNIDFRESLTIKRDASVTAISFIANCEQDCVVLAAGEESGRISLHLISLTKPLSLVRSVDLQPEDCPSKSITRLAWRDMSTQHSQNKSCSQLAIAAADGSVRIIGVDVEDFCTSQA